MLKLVFKSLNRIVLPEYKEFLKVLFSNLKNEKTMYENVMIHNSKKDTPLHSSIAQSTYEKFLSKQFQLFLVGEVYEEVTMKLRKLIDYK